MPPALEVGGTLSSMAQRAWPHDFMRFVFTAATLFLRVLLRGSWAAEKHSVPRGGLDPSSTLDRPGCSSWHARAQVGNAVEARPCIAT
mmetsp:Transcript_16326/g.41469  ORF Transcript_16326/g.41469 Transcript_16326/m.41469 type:complete len:88 (-) Transcript_16326:509-772(-)